MPFEPGNNLGAKSRLVSNALERAVTQDDGQRIRQGIEKILDLFAAGDRWAVEWLTDRTEGKAQSTLNIVNKKIIELTDDELLAVASRDRAIESQSSETDSSPIH